MKKLILALLLVFLFTIPLWVNALNRWEWVLSQVEQGEMQLAVTVNPTNVPVLPEVLTKVEVVEWLSKGWLVPEKPSALKAPAPGAKCHVAYYWVGWPYYEWRSKCVGGPGVIRCPCGDEGIQYRIHNL